MDNPESVNNEALTAAMVDLKRKGSRLSVSFWATTLAGDKPLHVSAYSFGFLDAAGALWKLLGIEEADRVKMFEAASISDISESAFFRGSKPEDMAREERVGHHLAKAASLEIYAFGAGRGDSYLVRFPDCNILIDGGIRMNPAPCFWPVLRRLPPDEQVDLMICTHYDEDHVAGLLRLLRECKKQQKKLGSELIKVGQLYTMVNSAPPPAGGGGGAHRGAGTGYQLCTLADFIGASVHNLKTDRSVFFTKETAQQKLEVLMVTPPDASTLTTATKKMAKFTKRAASVPNLASASILLTVKSTEDDSVLHRALFTGDAPSYSIVSGIRSLLPEGAEKMPLAFCDAPHHGTSGEGPEDLFACIDPSLMFVSSDGSGGHGHPDKTFLQAMKPNVPNRRVWFNYKSHALPGRNRNSKAVKQKKAGKAVDIREDTVQHYMGDGANYMDNQTKQVPTEYFVLNVATSVASAVPVADTA